MVRGGKCVLNFVAYATKFSTPRDGLNSQKFHGLWRPEVRSSPTVSRSRVDARSARAFFGEQPIAVARQANDNADRLAARRASAGIARASPPASGPTGLRVQL